MTFTPLAPAPANRSPGDTSITGDNNANSTSISNINDFLSSPAASERTVVAPTDSLAAIQDAIDAGPVWFLPGTYDVTTAFTLPSGADIDGPASAVLRRPNGSNGKVFDAAAVAGLRIAGVTVDGNKAGQTTQATPITVAGSDITLERLTVKNSSGYGILIGAGSERVTARGCTVLDADLSGIVLNGTATSPVQRVLIEGCHVAGPGQHALHNLGIASWVTYANNILFNTGQDGISAYNAGNRHQLLVGNTIRDAGNNLVHTGGNHVGIVDNLGLTAATHGWFHRNHDGSASTDYLIVGNTTEGVTSRSVHVDAAHDGSIADNVVRGGGTHAIEVVLCNRVSLTGNIVQQSVNDGIVLMGCNRITLAGNTVHSNGRFGIYMRQEPGSLTETTETVVSGNGVYDNGNTGVASASGADRACVVGNIVRGNTTAQISLVGTNNVQANNITA